MSQDSEVPAPGLTMAERPSVHLLSRGQLLPASNSSIAMLTRSHSDCTIELPMTERLVMGDLANTLQQD
jgi:hypothetical protein